VPTEKRKEEMMKHNMGTIDRALRFFVMGPLAVWGAVAGFSSAWSVVIYAIAGIMFATAVVGFCPLYALLHIDTRSRRAKAGV
jgi:uncharacterized membrane protein YuzA (DUF378 family)